MSHRKLTSIAFVFASVLCIMSCKKDDETTIPPALNGTLSFNVPEYVLPNTVITMTPSGVTHPDNEEIGYYWKVTPTMTKADTTRYENGLDKLGNPSDGSFTHKFSDTLKTYTVTGYAYAKGYSYTSGTKYCDVVEGGIDKSITGLNLNSRKSETIDGRKYPYVTIAGTDWLCRNISDESAGAPYKNCKAMSDVFGRYYTYEEALDICPDGWRLPTDAEWTAMAEASGAAKKDQAYSTMEGIAAALMGNARFNDELMWEYWPEVGDITDASGLSIIPAGYAMLSSRDNNPKQDPSMDFSYPQAQFRGYQEYAIFWTADKVSGEEGMAYYRYMICNQPDMMIGKGDARTFGASVRCVR